LKNNEIKIAVCTSDNRAGTEAVLKELDVNHYIDILICGDVVASAKMPGRTLSLSGQNPIVLNILFSICKPVALFNLKYRKHNITI
jgi:phosphoglycolate phosphatase-like HAD superfamily hydrolase